MVLNFDAAQFAFGVTETQEPPYSPIVFSNIVEDLLTTTSIRVAWDVTPGAQGQLEYGPTTDYGSVTQLETNYLTFHRQTIDLLDSDTPYHYRIKGVTVDGQTAYSADRTFTTEAIVVPPPPPAGSAIDLAYGTCGFNTVSNLRLWFGLACSYRWRAPFTKYLRSLRWYVILDRPGGYASGDGGIIEITLRADNPNVSALPGAGVSGTHMWTGSALSSCPNRTWTEAEMQSEGWADELTSFTNPYQVQAGTLYHIVFRNIHSDPNNNNMSPDVNAGLSSGPNPRWGPGSIDFGVVFDALESGVAHRPGHSPLMDLSFSDTPTGPITAHYGDGHLQVEQAHTFGGNTMLRERVTVSERERRVDGAWAYVERVSGTSPLVVTLENSSGGFIDEAQFPYTDFQTGNGLRGNNTNPVWVFRPFSAIRTLALNTTYNVRFSAAAGTTYMMEGYQKGVNYGYHLSTCFPDGIFQKSTGGAAGSWVTFGGEDIHFYLRYAP